MSSTIDSFSTSTNVATIVNSAPPRTFESQFPATEAQLEVWLSSQQSVEANCAYNEISSLEFRGELDVERLKLAIDKVVARNASLRSTFSPDGYEVRVHADVVYSYETADLTGDQTRDGGQLSIVQTQARTPFDLVNGPLLRVVLQKFSDTHHKLTFAAHHIVLDGWSLAVFCRDLGYFYDTLSGETRDELPPVNSYADYAQKMESYFDSNEGKADEAFWVDQFADQIPVLDLPIERSRPALRTYYGRRYDHQFSTELVEKVRKIGAKSGCSLFNTMLAAFNAYVARISGNDDFCVGIPTAGQAALDQPELIGHCVNTMPLRTQVDVNAPFVEHMKATRKTLLDSFDHQRYSYGTLLRKLAPPRDPSRPPMLSVSFNVDPVIDVSELGFSGLEVDAIVEPRSFENFEWFINGVIQKDKSIEMQVQYNSDLYSTESMEFYFEGFATFLEGLTAQPEAPMADIHLMSVRHRQKVLVDWNQTELAYPIEATLSSEFSRQAAATPDNIAVKFEDVALTYAEVESRSNQIARHLKSHGVAAGDLVGICVDRSEQMLVNLYGIMKAGAGYVPLDPAYPNDRLQYMCDHSELKLIVTHSSLSERVADFNKPQLAIDSVAEEIAALSSEPFESNAKPEDTCYVIYTSGSTGKPKGVQVPHGAVVNFLYAMRETPGFTENDSVLAVTTLSFDIAVLELYLPTIFGGQVVILDSLTAADGVKLADQLKQHDISLMQATPATWRLMIQSNWAGKQNLKVLCGGEPMPQDLVAPLLDRCNELWNMYGPTETTVWSAAFQITSPTAPILIGKPVGNTQIYILDANGNEVPVGCEGEVFIGGAGVTLGYLNREDLTSERFVENRYRNPFTDYVSDQLYKTGDLAKYTLNGSIQFLRRNDKQVKVRGFRIELGEIERTLESHPSLQQNVVIVREDTVGDARLVAYVIVKPEASFDAGAMRDHLRQSLPYYMVPQHFVELDVMPQTNNGKIDYKALPAPTAEVASASDVSMPETEAEKYLASVWEQILEMDDVGLNDTFFDIGGHSLLVMKVITTVHEKTGIKLGPQDFLMCTLEQLATKISESFAFKADSSTKQPSKGKNESADSSRRVEADKSETILPASENQKPDPSSEKKGMFRSLKGFWD